MNNDIKEILEALKPHNDNVKEYPLTLSIEQQKLLLDYITNLKEAKQNADVRNGRQRIVNKKLMEDIERLRTNLKTHKRRRKKQTHKKNIYKSRCEKAIEYIKHLDNVFIDDKKQDEILNILEGSDKE